MNAVFDTLIPSFLTVLCIQTSATSSLSPTMDETYDSDSSDGSVIIPSSSVIPESSPANDPASESYKGQQFITVDHTANIRNRSEVSEIWRHSFERCRWYL